MLYALLTPGARRVLWSPGPYLAVLIGFAAFTPVILWNAENEWASFLFQGGRAVSRATACRLISSMLVCYDCPHTSCLRQRGASPVA